VNLLFKVLISFWLVIAYCAKIETFEPLFMLASLLRIFPSTSLDKFMVFSLFFSYAFRFFSLWYVAKSER
jgi:hypothetical protein